MDIIFLSFLWRKIDSKTKLYLEINDFNAILYIMCKYCKFI